MFMDHVVYLDAKAHELEQLLEGSKTMIIRGATGRKLPYGRVNTGDKLYLINNNGEGQVKARAVVKSVLNSDKLSEDESAQLIETNQDKLHLTDQQIKRWSGKRYLVLVAVEDVKPLEPFFIDKSRFGNMDDWLPVEDIATVKRN
jgi:hypothetical protein